MKKQIIILLLLIGFFMSGCIEKEQKFVCTQAPEKYIVFSNDERQTAFYHSGGVENVKGTWTETEEEYTFWIDEDNGGNVIFKKLEDGSIGLLYDRNDMSKMVIYEKE
jgi:outer membrane lipoprotein-sorting protein